MYSVFVKLMEEKGLTPYRVAKETGITQATLSRWKTGKVNPSLETLQVLADYFHVLEVFLLIMFYVFGFAPIGCLAIVSCAAILAIRYFFLYCSL